MTSSKKGKVWLVGAGPGDPELLTLKGARILRQADVVFYDWLANERLLDHTRADCEKIYVGKKQSNKSLPQKEITQHLIDGARAGKKVVRLKGGDPFIFGRGGEEVEELAQAGVDYEIVPGVTSAIAAPAYAGIPLTHRNFSSSVAFVTGHVDPLKDPHDFSEDGEGSDEDYAHWIPWDALPRMGTIVFLMAVSHLRDNMKRLVAYGITGDTPAAAIEWGSYVHQKTVKATVATLADEVLKASLAPPCVVVVGKVVSLRDKLQWFEKKPLLGKKVLLTRASDKRQENLRGLLQEEGATVLEAPLVSIAPPTHFTEFDRCLSSLASYQWLVLTSVHGVEAFVARLKILQMPLLLPSSMKVAAVGSATAQALKEAGFRVDLIPSESHSEGFLKAFEGINPGKVLFPRAKEGRTELIEGLRKDGFEVDVVEAYRTLFNEEGIREIEKILETQKIDWIAFTSASSVKALESLKARGPLSQWLKGIKIASIGPTTSKALKELSLEADVCASQAHLASLVEAIIQGTSVRDSQSS